MRRPRRSVTALAAVVVAGVLGVGVTVVRDSGHVPAGPLADPDAAGSGGASANVGNVYSFGPLVVTNTSGKTVTLDGFGPTATPAGLVVAGSYAMRALGGRIMIVQGFPENGVAEPRYQVRGLVLPPHSHGYELVLGVRIVRPGRFTLPRLRVIYHSGRKRYRALYELSFTMCAPRKAIPVCDPAR